MFDLVGLKPDGSAQALAIEYKKGRISLKFGPNFAILDRIFDMRGSLLLPDHSLQSQGDLPDEDPLEPIQDVASEEICEAVVADFIAHSNIQYQGDRLYAMTNLPSNAPD